MKIGVVCEGQTDLIAIKKFVGLSFSNRGAPVEFIELQPQSDNTRAAGWTQVFNWIMRNPIELRNTQYFGDGLFAGGLSAKRCDAILFQIDTDIIGDDGFENWLKKQEMIPRRPTAAADRADFVEEMLKEVVGYEGLDHNAKKKHLFFPAVESTETWCISAKLGLCQSNPEGLSAEQLKTYFGWLVADLTEQARASSYSRVNKRQETRKTICDKLEIVEPLEEKCPQYLRYIEVNFEKCKSP